MNRLPHANKDLGQHFLKDQEVIQKITQDFADDCECILEIGPGPAVLTKELAEHGKPLAVVETDLRMKEYLEEYIKDEKILFMDALKLDEQELMQKLSWESKNVWLVSNLPYNIASPLIVKFLQWPTIKSMTLMVQKEVGFKIIGKTSKKKEEMSSLHALCSTYFEVSELCRVDPEAFLPPPKVDSMVVSFKRIAAPVIELSDFLNYEKFLRSVFKLRRKQVYNVMKTHYSTEALDGAFAHCNIDRKARAETFNKATIQLLYSYLNS